MATSYHAFNVIVTSTMKINSKTKSYTWYSVSACECKINDFSIFTCTYNML